MLKCPNCKRKLYPKDGGGSYCKNCSFVNDPKYMGKEGNKKRYVIYRNKPDGVIQPILSFVANKLKNFKFDSPESYIMEERDLYENKRI